MSARTTCILCGGPLPTGRRVSMSEQLRRGLLLGMLNLRRGGLAAVPAGRLRELLGSPVRGSHSLYLRQLADAGLVLRQQPCEGVARYTYALTDAGVLATEDYESEWTATNDKKEEAR